MYEGSSFLMSKVFCEVQLMVPYGPLRVPTYRAPSPSVFFVTFRTQVIVESSSFLIWYFSLDDFFFIVSKNTHYPGHDSLARAPRPVLSSSTIPGSLLHLLRVIGGCRGSPLRARGFSSLVQNSSRC